MSINQKPRLQKYKVGSLQSIYNLKYEESIELDKGQLGSKVIKN